VDFEYYNLIEALANCATSLTRVLIGTLCALVASLFAGFLRSHLPPFLKNKSIINFLFEAPKFPPPIAWIPFVIIICGIGEISAYTIVFIGAFSPIFTSIYAAIESTPIIWTQAARSMEISGVKYYKNILFMSILPQIFTGLRSGFSMGWMSVIAAEMVSGDSGLGYSIQLNRLNMQYDLMVIDMLLIGLVGFLLFESISLIEKWVMPWRFVNIDNRK